FYYGLSFVETRHLATPTPFPYTTLFRSPVQSKERFRRNIVEEKAASFVRADLKWAEEVRRPPIHLNETDFCSADRFAVPMHTARSEEHTSELQSRENVVCRLLLEKKNLL